MVVVSRKPALLFIGLLVTTSMGSGCAKKGAEADESQLLTTVAESASVSVRVTPAEERSIAPSLTVLGRCEALPDRQAVLEPLVEGQIVKLLAQQGDEVTAGQPIVQCDTALAATDVAEKQAARDSTAASLAALKSLPREEEKRSAALSVETSKIMVEKAQAVVDRIRPLRERGEIPQSQLFEAETAVKEALLQQRTAEAQLKLLEMPPRPELIAEAESKIKAADEALKSSMTRLNLLTIKAPISGVLVNLVCHPGQTCSVGTSIGEIIDSREVLATVWMPVARGRQIKMGSTARIHAASKMDGAGSLAPQHELSGKVTLVGRNVDPQTGNVPVQILVQNNGNMLFVGQTLAADVFLTEPTKMLCVPTQAVHDEGSGNAITVVRDGKAMVLQPQFGISDGTWTAVSNVKLNPGEPVITSGGYNLPDGTEVTVEGAVTESLKSE